MAKYKVKKTQLNQNLNGEYFNDTPSNTIFSFGKFFVTTNFDNKVTIDYTNTLSSFVRPVTLETLGVSETQSEIIQEYTTNAVLNLDKSDLNTFVRYGSAYEFLRVSVQNIITKYPGSLFANSQIVNGGNPTYQGFNYDETSNISTFYIPTGYTVNTFGLVFNAGNLSIPDDEELKNLNISYDKYVIWSSLEPDVLFKVVGYTGNTVNSSDQFERENLKLQVEGNPFNLMGTGLTGVLDYHMRPNNIIFEEFRALLNSYEKNIVSKRVGTDGFSFTLKEPTLLEDGKIVYSDSNVVWVTSDDYNIDINTPNYDKFLQIVLTIGAKYDKIKTDLIARFLTPTSLKTYDLTEDGKISKLLRVYGREFDQIRQFIDSLVNINKVTYDKLNNVPDQIVKNMANTFGWDYFSLVNEDELVEGFLTIDDTERDLNEDILPAEIDVELWRRIINNTSYFWKSKGTRQAIKSMFLLIGIPEPFINITEYVYTVEGKINPNTVPLAQDDFPSNSLPYDTDGYPVAPLETNDFYFQLSGNTDAGQTYLDVFRSAGFNLKQTPDNKKSWVQTGATTRIHNTTPQYYQEDSRLVINTKEVDVALDTARGIEYDVYKYIQKDFAANSEGYTLPYSYVNISSSISQAGNTFTLPANYSQQGDLEVRYNGILLNAPSIDNVSNSTEADYSVNGDSFTIFELSGGTRASDVIQATFVNSGGTAVTGITVDYIVTRVNANLNGTYVPLPSYPRGDVQLTINGIALTKGTPQLIADYTLDPANSTGGTNQIIIQNPDVVAYLNDNPNVQISYVEVQGSNDINLRSEITRIDSFNSGKIYYNNSANKYVYKLNYKVNNTSEVKFLINGIALEPNTDYTINVQNPYEIFLPKGLRYGTVISAYYLVGGAGAFDPVINDAFGLGDISELSFLEFIELIQRKMINARTRKVVTDFKGGWYPSLLRLYETYLERALLPDDDPLQSNGYTFQNLYPFLSKYNAFFQRFVDQLLSATIIIRRGGLLIRNSVFTKQKHWYKRGVNVANPNDSTKDMRGNVLSQYFGSDDATYEINQDSYVPPPPVYTVTTSVALPTEWNSGNGAGIRYFGGYNAVGLNQSEYYGVEARYLSGTIWSSWNRAAGKSGPITATRYEFDNISGFLPDTLYEYRAFIDLETNQKVTGNTLSLTTNGPPVVITPSIVTTTGTAHVSETVDSGTILDTGGQNIVGYDDVQYHGMEYRKGTSGAWTLSPDPPEDVKLFVDNYHVSIENLDADSTYQYHARMVVAGIVYTGQTITANIPAIQTSKPNARTGVVNIVGTNNFTVTGNEMVTDGGSAVTEYGTLYSQDSQVTKGTGGVVPFQAPPLGGGKLPPLAAETFCKSNTLPIADGDKWNDSISGLGDGTKYYYKAYACNANGIDNGLINNVTTEEGVTPPSGFAVKVCYLWVESNPTFEGFGGNVCLMEGSTTKDSYSVGTISNPTSNDFSRTSYADASSSNTFDGSGIYSVKQGSLPADICWSDDNFITSHQGSRIFSITSACTYWLKIKDGEAH